MSREKVVYVAVGFKVDQTRSIGYRKATNLLDHNRDIRVLYQKGAQFVSSRRVVEK